jgi:hypothetical protein
MTMSSAIAFLLFGTQVLCFDNADENTRGWCEGRNLGTWRALVWVPPELRLI